MIILRNCLTCKQEFNPPVGEVNRGKGNYCSLKCSNIAKKKPKIIKECLWCKKPFETQMKKINRGGGKYCSMKCACILIAKNREKERTSRKCLICDKEFKVKTYKIKYGAGKYCSVSCKNSGIVKEKIKRNCMTCNKEFIARNHEIKKGRSLFCSYSCSTIHASKINFKTESERFLLKISNGIHENGCWIWDAAKDINGYGVFSSFLNEKGSKSHRYSWELFNNKKIPAGLIVCHKCDNPICVNPSHLFIGTHKDNHDDMVKKGRAYYQKKDKELQGAIA